MNAKVCDRCGAFYKYTIDRIQMPGWFCFVKIMENHNSLTESRVEICVPGVLKVLQIGTTVRRSVRKMIDQYVWWSYLSERQMRWNEEHPGLFEKILKQIEEEISNDR